LYNVEIDNGHGSKHINDLNTPKCEPWSNGAVFFVYLQTWVIIYEVNVGKQKPAPASYLVDRCSSPVSSSDFFGPISDQNDDWFNGHIRQK